MCSKYLTIEIDFKLLKSPLTMTLHFFSNIITNDFRLNGLYMWVPDILNRVLTGNQTGLTACDVIAQRLNQVDT